MEDWRKLSNIFPNIEPLLFVTCRSNLQTLCHLTVCLRILCQSISILFLSSLPVPTRTEIYAILGHE